MLNFFKRRAATQGDDLRYEDIPCKQDRAVEAETYPQKSRPIPALPMHDIVDRYSGLLRSILDNLPLTSEEINRLIMPVVSRLIRLIHLLPASEAQHHSGCGGLLVHSLESAAIGMLYGICQGTSKKIMRRLPIRGTPRQGLCPYASLPQDIFET